MKESIKKVYSCEVCISLDLLRQPPIAIDNAIMDIEFLKRTWQKNPPTTDDKLEVKY